MGDLPAGRYALVVANESREHEDWVVAREEVTVLDGDTAEVHLELPPHFQVRGPSARQGCRSPGARST